MFVRSIIRRTKTAVQDIVRQFFVNGSLLAGPLQLATLSYSILGFSLQGGEAEKSMKLDFSAAGFGVQGFL
jgi:hypothetical protein